jgi:hypothetical protein
MSFTPNIPVIGQSLGSSRTEVSNNFAVLRSTLAANHIDVNSENAGLHNLASFVAQSSDPTIATGIVPLYSKTLSSTGVTELFFRRENSGTVIQMTVGNPTASSSGSTFLPGGIILKWGQVVPGTSGAFVTFSGSFPNAVFSVVPGINNVYSSNNIISVSGATQEGFNIYTGNPASTHFYFAIGN